MGTIKINHDDQPNDVVEKFEYLLNIIGISIIVVESGDGFIKYTVKEDPYLKYRFEWLKENPPFSGPYTDKLLTRDEFVKKHL